MSARKKIVDKLTAKQQRALEALLVGASDQQAAQSAGVTRYTVIHWRSSVPAFDSALKDARADLLRRTTARLHAATSIAVKALEDVAKDTRNPSARVSAARAIIELSQRAIEIDELQRRVEDIEIRIAETQGRAA